MVFTILLYVSLAVYLAGLIYKISRWFIQTVNTLNSNPSASKRISAFIKGFLGALFSRKLLTLIKVFILDVLLQVRVLKEDTLRWAMHMCIYGGFTLLLLMHALGGIITISLFSDYSSTLNPFFLLRNIFGIIVVLGIGIAFYRRNILKVPRLKTNIMDRYAVVILAIIMASGFFLEGLKITSHSLFMDMIEEYSDVDIEEEDKVKALESLWVKEFGLISPEVSGPFDDEVIEQGIEIHDMNCAGCHSSPQWAFGGFIISRVISPIAISLDRTHVTDILYYIHILACFIGLAYLPFSKMFHIIATPLSLLSNSVMDNDKSDPANIATRQVMELDACTHCCTCSLYCSAMMANKAIGNDYILPSEKMVVLKDLVAGKNINQKAFKAIQEGVYLCTNCDRCTVVCPSGINLKDLWVNVREGLIHKGVPEPLLLSPFSLVRGLNKKGAIPKDYQGPLDTTRKYIKGRFDKLIEPDIPILFPPDDNNREGLEIKDSTFRYCFGCTNCTNVCPVVNNYDNPQAALGLLPHQIMCSLGLGLDEMASGPNMLWDCVTCYQCQEHCPQEVKVTDILYDLKNIAVRKAEG
ncbi:4Fe-4S dicluster domain-containing protein [Thermodesulfobacteriota bacterium]